MTGRDYCTSALQELGVYGPTDTPSDEDLVFAETKFNRLLDSWNADRLKVYTEVFNDYVLVPGLNPHTIGPTGATFTLGVRPVALKRAAIILTNVTPNVFIPITVQDDEWYAQQPAPALSTSIPTDVFYQRSWPNGALYFFPVPQTAYSVRLWTAVLLTQITLDTVISLPPGYQEALILSLAEVLLPNYPRKTLADTLMALAARARMRIEENNSNPPRVDARDSGQPGGTPKRPYFNYLRGF